MPREGGVDKERSAEAALLHSYLERQGSFHITILYCLAQMGGLDIVRIRQIGDRPRHAQHAMSSACRKVQALNGRCQQAPIGRSESTVAFDVLHREMLIGAVVTTQLPIAGALYAGAHQRAFVPPVLSRRDHVAYRQWRQLDLNVDTVEQRPGDAFAVTLHLLGGAMTAPAGVAEMSAGASLRCPFAT